MTGGLIQIVAYGTADVFLTGMPQITFFKLVYRRHTNFAIENIEQQFSGTKNFGNTISCTIDKVGDLVSKMYLKVVLPTVFLQNPFFQSDYAPNDVIEIGNLKNQYVEYKAIINYFFKFYRELYSYINNINQNVNITNLFNKIQQIANLYYNSSDYNTVKTKYNATYNIKVLINDFLIETDFYDKNSNYLYQNMNFNNLRVSDTDLVRNVVNYKLSDYTTSNALLNKIKTDLNDFISNTSKIDMYLFSNIKNYERIHKNYQNYKFAWVKKIGHNLIKDMFIEIGGQIVDRHNNDWYNIWNELSLNSEMEGVYNKMIGNIDSLIKYDNSTKNSYTLYIPLQFWFNKYVSGALPLVFLRYSEVRLQIELNDIRKLIVTDAPLDYNFEDSIQLNNISLLTDYIYLDVDERTKFAQSPQETLIEVVQNYNYIDINTINTTIESFFVNSVKEMFWVTQSVKNLNNNFHDLYDLGIIYKINNISKVITNNLEQKIQINIGKHVFNKGDTIRLFNSENYNKDYQIIDIDSESITVYSKFYKNEINCYIQLVDFKDNDSSLIAKNPITNTSYTFEQYNRFQNYDNIYTNYVQPYQFHTKTPVDGINSYSFSLSPEEYQPSGSANLSSYKYKSFIFEFNKKLIEHIQMNNDKLIVKTYALGYNFLSFKNGMAGLIFNI